MCSGKAAFCDDFSKRLCILGKDFSCLCKVPFSSTLRGWEMQELDVHAAFSDDLEYMCYGIDFNQNDCIRFSFISHLLHSTK